MSTPHIAWAFAQRKLTAAQRVVLIALAERANGERTCFPSEETLAADCELSRRSVIAAVQYLHEERRLIEVVTDQAERAAILAKAGARQTSRVNVYRILRPYDGEKSAHHNGAKSARPPSNESAKSAPLDNHNGAKPSHNRVEREKSAHSGDSEGAKSASRECKKRTIEGAPFAHEPLNESLQEEKRRASAPEGKDLNAGKKEDAAPSSVSPTTRGGRSSSAFLDDPSPDDALPCEIEQEVISADLPDADAPVDPEYVRAIVAELKHEWRSRAYPPRLSDLTRDEQATVCQDKPSIRSAYLPDAILRLQRRQAGIRHAADA